MWIAPHLRQLEIKNKDVRKFPSQLYSGSQLIINYVKSDQFLQSGQAPLSLRIHCIYGLSR